MWNKPNPVHRGAPFGPRGPLRPGPLLGTPRFHPPPPPFGLRGLRPPLPPPPFGPPPPPLPPFHRGPMRGPRLRMQNDGPYFCHPPPHLLGPPPLPGPRLHNRRFQMRGRKRKHVDNSSQTRDDKNKSMKKEKEFFCDTCDRGFETRDQLDEHYGTHEKCGRDGCTFEAHQKIVELHIKMQHETGFAEKIMVLNSPEEIEKWKGERKKNFPSLENVIKRQAEQAEKLARGELLPTKEFGKFRRGGQQNRGQQRNGLGGHQLRMSGPLPPGPRFIGGPPVRRRQGNYRGKSRGSHFRRRGDGRKDKGNLKKFSGTEVVPEEKSTDANGRPAETNNVSSKDKPADLITDSECEANASASDDKVPAEVASNGNQVGVAVSIPSVPLVLKNLLAAYQSETETEEPASQIKSHPQVLLSLTASPKVKGQNQAMMPYKPQETFAGRHRVTLLEMLLAKEIRHERNVILQCVRYIVENQFFEKKDGNF